MTNQTSLSGQDGINPEQGASLLELAARCEAATGPDRDLDAAMHKAITSFPARVGGVGWSFGTLVVPAFPGWSELPFYTASLDAAMTLVPTDGSMNFVDFTWSWEPGEAGVYPAAAVRWYPPHHSGPNWHAEVVCAASMALTICAAALKVRARSKPAPDINIGEHHVAG